MILLAAHLAAAVALLLWSVRLIRTGVERAFLPQLKRLLKALSRRSASAAGGGLLAAMVLQSSTAVALIGGGFAASGMVSSSTGLALLLGADLGSAVMVNVLILPVEAVVPFVLLAGVVLFLNAKVRTAKQVGRILIGFALVLHSLTLLRGVTAPIGDAALVQAIAAYFSDDLVSAFAIGAVLAWVMHSSLAAVLTFAAFAAAGSIGLPVAAALVIGANLGGAVVPVVLLSGAPREARLVAYANLIARAATTAFFLVALLLWRGDTPLAGLGAGQQVVLLHLALNAVLLVLSLPLVGVLVKGAGLLLPEQPGTADGAPTALDEDALSQPRQALACGQREVLRMAETLEAMLLPVVSLFRTYDDQTAKDIQAREDQIDRMHYETKLYISQLRETTLSDTQDRRAVELVAVANGLEEAADRIAANLVGLARKMQAKALTFSDEGIEDIEAFHDQIVTNARLALNVLTTGDAEIARQLVAEKDRIRREEQILQERHLRRLGEGGAASVDTTNIHQEVLRVLKQVNAALSYVAYPIAEETGDLLSSRLARPLSAGRTV